MIKLPSNGQIYRYAHKIPMLCKCSARTRQLMGPSCHALARGVGCPPPASTVQANFLHRLRRGPARKVQGVFGWRRLQGGSLPEDKLGDDVEDGEALGGGTILCGQHGRAQ